jgi:hypothetical protein
MSTISTTASSGNTIAALLADIGSTPTEAAPSQPSAGKAAASDHGPATTVQLSDDVKAILAKAQSDQAAADRLQSFVASRRGNVGTTPAATTGAASKNDIDKTFQQLTSASSASTDDSNELTPVEPTHSFSNVAQFAGFAASVHANAKDGSLSVQINGPRGLEFSHKRFGQTGEIAGFGYSGMVPGPIYGVGDWDRGNVEYVSFAENDAAAVSTSISTDGATASAGAVSAHASTITFAIDFSTGSIQMTRSDAYAAATAQTSSSVSVVA